MTTQKNKLKELLTRTVIPTDSQTSKHISEYIKMISDDIDRIIETIKSEYGVETDRSELLLDVKRVDGLNLTTNQKETTFQLVIYPTQKLMEKFSKDYPELLI